MKWVKVAAYLIGRFSLAENGCFLQHLQCARDLVDIPADGYSNSSQRIVIGVDLGTAKLLDMGLARFSRDDTDQITVKYDDKNVLGSADYVAPEQTRDSRNIDTRADLEYAPTEHVLDYFPPS